MLLVLVAIKGQSALGAQRWIRLGPFVTIQPSEFAKLGLLLALATFFSQAKEPLSVKSIFTALALTGVPLILVLKQPDLGTSIILAAILLSLLFFLGINQFLLFSSVALSGALLLKILKPFQRERLLVFLHPRKDPTRSGWNIIQSLIAVGSGKLAGKGLFAGTQTQLKFVPEHSTDFIFTVIAEEFGFLGSTMMLVLYFIILWYGSRIALETDELIGKLLAGGIVAMIFFHVLINVGMTMGIMPITGIPLPFISSGGSSLITNMVAVAFLLNIEYRRDRVIPF
jgi:rod shape determining protein RodA